MNNRVATRFTFLGDLPLLLKNRWRSSPTVEILLNRRTSIKDMIESLGLPHTEVGSIQVADREIGFHEIVVKGSSYCVHPVPAPWDVTAATFLRPNPLPGVIFIVDVNVGRLARYLRALGFDTVYDRRYRDSELADRASSEKRILLTRDLRLLMRSKVEFGHFVRAIDPLDQLAEVAELFNLGTLSHPFSRCLECNQPLQPVSREAILHRLEPLTRKYYRSFSMCLACDKIYWPGSHVEGMHKLVRVGQFQGEGNKGRRE